MYVQQKLQNGIVRANLGVKYHAENKVKRKRAIKRKNYNYACSKKQMETVRLNF